MADDIFLIEEATVSRAQFRIAIAVIAFLIITGAIVTPFANTPLVSIPGYMTAFGAAMIVINLLLAAFLFSKGAIEQRGDAIRLGVAYLYIAVIFIPLVASFPGGLMSAPLIGSGVTPVWLWSFWHIGFGLGIIRYALGASSVKGGKPSSVRISIAIVIGIVSILTMIATVWLPYLPAVFANGQTFFTGNNLLIPALVLSTNLMALASVAKLRCRTPEQLWLTASMVAACLDVWLTVYGGNRFALGWYFAKFGSLLTSLFVLISHFHSLTVLYRNVANANRLLTKLAHKDGLTGLSNRRAFDDTLKKEWQRGRRQKQHLVLLMIDIDFFKKYNDTYGHQQGDDCLRRIAAQLQEEAKRPGDEACRYGGEEFALILPNTDAAGADHVAQNMLRNISELAISHEQNPPHHIVTASIGYASVVPGEGLTVADLISAADRALYQAKASGRNRANAGLLEAHPMMAATASMA